MAAPIEVLRTLEERAQPEHTALLVIDMQNDYCSPGGASGRIGCDLSYIRAIVPRVRALIAAARRVHIPIVFTKFTIEPGAAGLSGPDLLRRGPIATSNGATVKGTWGHELVPELPYRQDEDLTIEKPRWSSFIGTDLDCFLRSSGVKTVAVAGVLTQGCVESTVREAVAYDYYVAVAQDCVASTDREAHLTGLWCMTKFLGYREAVTDSRRLLGIWAASRGVAGTYGGANRRVTARDRDLRAPRAVSSRMAGLLRLLPA
jgi:nicotinamidase-related amidase